MHAERERRPATRALGFAAGALNNDRVRRKRPQARERLQNVAFFYAFTQERGYFIGQPEAAVIV